MGIHEYCIMEAPRSEQENEDVSTEYMLKMMADIPLENVQLISQTMQVCRSRLDGWPGSGRLLGADSLCPSCSTPWMCGQYRAELQPRPAATKPLRRLLNKHREARPMGRVQTRLLHRFLAARDMIVLECKRCSKVTKLPIVSRSGRGKSGPEPTQIPAQVTPGVTPTASGRRRCRARDKNAGLVIPASLRSLRTPATPASRATPAAAAAAAAASAAAAAAAVVTSAAAAVAETPELGQSPNFRLCPPSEQTLASDAPSATVDSPVSDVASAAAIPLKKSRGTRLPTPASSSDARNLSGVATPAAVPLKRSRPESFPGRSGRQSGRGRGGSGAGAASTPATPATPGSAASAREKQRRLQKILAQADCRTSNTGLMAFLSEL